MRETCVCTNLTGLNSVCHFQFSAIYKYGLKIIYINRKLDYLFINDKIWVTCMKI